MCWLLLMFSNFYLLFFSYSLDSFLGLENSIPQVKYMPAANTLRLPIQTPCFFEGQGKWNKKRTAKNISFWSAISISLRPPISSQICVLEPEVPLFMILISHSFVLWQHFIHDAPLADHLYWAIDDSTYIYSVNSVTFSAFEGRKNTTSIFVILKILSSASRWRIQDKFNALKITFKVNGNMDSYVKSNCSSDSIAYYYAGGQWL